MTEENIEKFFSDIDIYYPGSKRKRKEPKPKKEVQILDWDSKPRKTTLPNGTQVDMFLIGSLCKALNRPLVTIRSWIKEGYLPQSPYRLPSTTTKSGEEYRGRRLYSRRMIEAAVEIFNQNRLFEEKRINWSQHQQVTKSLVDSWNKIREDENKMTTDEKR
jgi:hypothetical protein